jgi:hypothetical protein
VSVAKLRLATEELYTLHKTRQLKIQDSVSTG